MFKNSLLGAEPGAKGLGGKAVAVLLTVALALMAWSPVTIGAAFANDEGASPSATADGDAADGKGPAGTQQGKAKGGDGNSSLDTEDPSDDDPASDSPAAANGEGEGAGNGSDTNAGKPEGAGEGNDDEISPNGKETEQGGDDDVSAPAGVGNGDGNGNETNPDGAKPGEGAQPDGKAASDNEGASPAASTDDKSRDKSTQASGKTPEGSAQAAANMGKVHPGIAATAEVLSKPSNGKTYRVGETIKFRITVCNTGNVPLYSARVSNLTSGAVSAPEVAGGSGYSASGTVASIDSLAPGKKVSISVNYKVLAADAGASISNTAIVKAVNPTDPQNPVSASASTDSVKVTPISKPTKAPKAVAPPAPAAPVAGVGDPVAKIEREAKPAPTVKPERKAAPDKKDDATGKNKDSWQLSDLLPIGVVGVLCLAVLIAAFMHKRREAAQNAES
ncbi:MAG: DUF11 domain-containing protein [Eggerthellaceae bacterium]|nr:DUF11 domain-containing protein [Eggerthellaceae bacterium]